MISAGHSFRRPAFLQEEKRREGRKEKEKRKTKEKKKTGKKKRKSLQFSGVGLRRSLAVTVTSMTSAAEAGHS